MPMRLPSVGALRAPSKSLLQLLRPFSSTASVARPPPRDTGRTPPSSAAADSSNSRLQAIGNDRAPSGRPRGPSAGSATVERMGQLFKARAAERLQQQQDRLDIAKSRKLSNDYLRQMPRRWAAGDVYSPHDLSPREMQKWRRVNLRKADVVDILGLNPLDLYKNFSLIQEFTNSSGQIRHNRETALRPVNQRKVAKMIRRIQGMGLYPTLHDHPELIRSDFYSSERGLSSDRRL